MIGIVAGTFDILHKGHKKLLKKAISKCEKLLIGLTSDEFAKKIKKHEVNNFNRRKKILRKYLKEKLRFSNFRVFKIENKYGFAIRAKADAIFVSEETYKTALRINELREKRGLKKLRIYKIAMVLAEDGKPISDKRIRKGIIDVNGKLLKRKR